jgi:hypothetical protein
VVSVACGSSLSACGSSATTVTNTKDGAAVMPDGAVEAADGTDGAASGPNDGAPADAAPTEGSTGDGSSFDCNAPPSDLAACTTSNDCTFVAQGCYCGQQPENGVATKYEAAQAACERTAADDCALGCAGFPGQRAQDGQSNVDGGTIAVRCASVDGGPLTCLTFVQ